MSVIYPFTQAGLPHGLPSDWRRRFTDEQHTVHVSAMISALSDQKATLEAQLASTAADAVRANMVGAPFEFAKVVTDIAAALDDVNGKIAFYQAALNGLGGA